jgi:desulfoferrodoxin (superoxide reductase-like protein)
MPRTKKTIAGRSLDLWIDEGRKEPPPPEEQRYTTSLIAFLDVLGIKTLISNHTDGTEQHAIEVIEEMRKIVKTSVEVLARQDDFYQLHISDSFVFLCNPADILVLLNLLSSIQTKILKECHFLLRGAVTIGDAIIQDEGKFIIGPAYIQAYLLQENDAVYPRIIVDANAARAVDEVAKTSDYLRQDSDKELFVDYIKVYMKRINIGRADMHSELVKSATFDFLRETYKEHRDRENHNIAQKYGWTMEYCKSHEIWEEE